ncbi:hypothetical protein H2201_008472 [Coniosporium apollinis]|uniref:BTB domain-containing protein n=1 Tax=Coniosporium apollinis TaxID=61459 RepID=A0ABQ9NG31_9PEZI|nr:hypothetical protein H2201_008472 [Coniosporium apollinis]
MAKYLDKLLNGPFQEAGRDTVAVDDICPSTFGCFVQWLNAQPPMPMIPSDVHQLEPLSIRGEFHASKKARAAIRYSDGRDDHPCGYRNGVVRMLLELCILGEKYEVHDLRQDVVSKIVDYGIHSVALEYVPDPVLIVAATEKLPCSSSLYHHFVDEFAYLSSVTMYSEAETEECRQTLPPRFLIDVLTAKKQLEESRGDIGDACQYHDHRDEAEFQHCSRTHMLRMVVWDEMGTAWIVDQGNVAVGCDILEW